MLKMKVKHTQMVLKKKSYEVCQDWMMLRCPKFMDPSVQNLIHQASISIESLDIWVAYLHNMDFCNTEDIMILLQLQWLCVLCDVEHEIFHQTLYGVWQDILDKSKTSPQWNAVIFEVLIQAYHLQRFYSNFLTQFYEFTAQYRHVYQSGLSIEHITLLLQQVSPEQAPDLIFTLTQIPKDGMSSQPLYTNSSKDVIDWKNTFPPTLDAIYQTLASQTQPPLITSIITHAPIVTPDLTLLTLDETCSFQCHSWFLYAKWHYFKKLMDFGGVEATSMHVILSEDWTPSCLYALLKYIYTQKIEFVEEDDIVWVIEHALQYNLVDSDGKPHIGFEALIYHCKEMIGGNLTNINCVTMYHLSNRLKLKERALLCYNYLKSRFSSLMTEKTTAMKLYTLEPPLLLQLLYDSYGHTLPCQDDGTCHS